MTQIMQKNAKVLVTGVTGYVGAHVAQQLLLHGYKVRGTVRSTADETKMNKLRQQITEGLPESLPELEFVEADLLNAESWPAAVAGCEFVAHVASPFPAEIPSDPDSIIKPAVDGTLNVLKAASDDGKVRRVVLTSSLAAVHDVKTMDGTQDPDKIYNEDNWVDPNKVEPYSKSKILAEQAGFKFVEELPQVDGKKKLEIVSINPCYVLGPMVSDALSTSVVVLKRLLDRSTPALPKFHMPICDVRDVALAHVKALEGPEHVGKRYLILTRSMWMKDAAHLIQKEFKPLGYFVPSLTVPNFIVWLGSFFDKKTAMVVPRLDKEFKLDNKRMIEELKLTPTDLEQTLIDTCHSLIERGIIKQSRKYKKSKQPPATKTEGQDEQPSTTAAGDASSQPQEIKVES